MAQTLPTVAELFGIEEQTLIRFRETLSHDDQQLLDELFETSQRYSLAGAQPTYPLPAALLLLTMLIEHEKMVQFLVDRLDYYDQKLYFKRVKPPFYAGEKPNKQ